MVPQVLSALRNSMGVSLSVRYTSIPITPTSAVGGYVTAAADTQSQALRVVFTATGTLALVLANVAFPTGTAGTSTTTPIAGARVPGSALTAILVPRSVVGSMAASFATPGAIFLVDRRPPNTAP